MNNPFMPPVNAFGMNRPQIPQGPLGMMGGAQPPATMGQYTAPAPAPVRSVPLQQGDSLSELARRYNTTISTLMYLNGMSSPDQIVSGGALLVPNSMNPAIPQAQAATQPMNMPPPANLQPPRPNPMIGMGGQPPQGPGSMMGGPLGALGGMMRR